MNNYYSFHNHCWASNQRFLDSINRPESMIARAIELGYSGIAFTDHESLSAAVAVLKIRDSIKEEHPDFKIIFGNEIYLIDQAEIKNTPRYYHFILLAKDEEGWQQLKALSSRAWGRGYSEKGIMRVPTTYQDIEEVVGRNPGHLFASTACIGGYLPSMILNHEVAKANNFIRWCINIFGANCVALELQPSDSEEQTTVNPILVKLARHYDIPFIVTTDSHYLNKEDLAIQSAFLNSKQSGDRETEKFYKFTYLQSLAEIRDNLKLSGLSDVEVDEAIANTAKIAEGIHDFDFRHSTIVPAIKLPEHFEVKHIFKEYYARYPLIEHYACSKYPQDRYLMCQIENGIISKK